MTIQAKLFDRPPEGAARKRDPETSKKAAREVRAGTLMAKVLGAIRASTVGMTIEEISTQCGLSVVSVSPRMKPLELRKLIQKSGKTRRNSSGYEATVYVATRKDRL